MTMMAGYAALCEEEYFKNKCTEICINREYTAKALKGMGFEVLNSKTNFLFAKSDKISGKELYERLKEKGVLIRHFNGGRIDNFNRITIGTKEQMDIFLEKVAAILKEKR